MLAFKQGGWNKLPASFTSHSVPPHSHTHSHTHTHTHIYTHSDPHSVASLLVQQLLSQFSTAFLANNGSSAATTADVSINSGIGGGGEGREVSSSPHCSLKEFLCQDTPLLLMLAIQIIGEKVPLTVCVDIT